MLSPVSAPLSAYAPPNTALLKSNLERRMIQVIEVFICSALTRSQNHRILCPITHELLKDPVMTKCGHVFERAAIENLGTCTVCNHKARGLTSDTATLELIENLKKAFVPTPAFLEDLKPNLYDLVKDSEEAVIARLYRSLYQLKIDKPMAAMGTLATDARTISHIKTLVIAFSILAHPTATSIQNAKAKALAIKDVNPSDSSFIYRQLVAYNQYDFESCLEIVSFMEDPSKKKEYLLKEADFACRSGYPEWEKTFLEEAEKIT